MISTYYYYHNGQAASLSMEKQKVVNYTYNILLTPCEGLGAGGSASTTGNLLTCEGLGARGSPQTRPQWFPYLRGVGMGDASDSNTVGLLTCEGLAWGTPQTL